MVTADASDPPGGSPSHWRVELTAEAEKWYMALDDHDAHRMAAAFDELQRRGPTLGRPFVDSIKGSRHHRMKELRSVGGHLRALFAFDPRRRAVVLLGGDKSGDWAGWYQRNIACADKLYDRHLRSLGKEGPWPGTGGPSVGRDR
ncbi:MAG: type II toxin-antitoxin system RelE/ParE family toxin [Solirubrobacterales bacterium]|nr:type II toxin-antitoxin system RelE/ParE family toxin [Solirubrobacterales bacterium]